MVKLRVRVGPKGQVVIPKLFRETYRIKEGGYVILEPRDDGLLIRGVEKPDVVVEWISKRRRKVKGVTGRLGELAHMELEGEFKV